MKDLLRYDLIENEAILNIDKVVVSFSFMDTFRETIAKMKVGDVLEHLDCDLRLKTVSIDESEVKNYEVEIISCREVFGRLLISTKVNTCLFISAPKSGYTLLKRDTSGNKISLLSYINTLASSLGLTFTNIEEITFVLDTTRNILGEIKGRLLDLTGESENIEEGKDDTILLMKSEYRREDKILPMGSWQDQCLLVTDTFANCNRLKIYCSTVTASDRRECIANWNEFETPLFYRVEVKAVSSEIKYASEEYNDNHNLNCSILEILGRMDMAKYVFNYIIDNMPTEMLAIDVVPDYFLKTVNERPHEPSHLLPIYTQRRLNIDALKLKCSHDGKLYSIIKDVPVGENIPMITSDFDLKVVEKKVEKDVMVTKIEISTIDGTFGYLTFKEGDEECYFEMNRKVFYTVLTRNIHEGTKHSLVNCLDYILETLNLELMAITNMTVCCDSDHNLLDKIWNILSETECKDSDDIIFTLVSLIKGKGDEATEEDLYKSTLIYTNIKTGMPQMRIYSSPSIADEERIIMEDWNEFKPFSRIEITFNEEQIQDFLSKYSHPYGNDYPILSFIDDEEFKRAALLYVIDNHIEPSKTDFDIRVEKV